MNANRSKTRVEAGRRAKRSAESELDALLQLRESRMKARAEVKQPPPAPPEIFRCNMEKEFIPVLDELSDKYIAKGIIVTWDVAGILAGGREMTIEFALPPHRTILRGTLARDVIAFELTRYVSETGGEVSSGPMLTLRTLDRARFREFICEQLGLMIKSMLRVTRHDG